MKAIVQLGYGGPEVLELQDIPVPAVPDDGVLIRASAAGLNAADYFVMAGTPFLARTAAGLPKPRPNYVVGLDVAGVVEAVGKDVTRFKAGDEVFAQCSPRADGSGACAEFACVPEDCAALKPENLSFAEAAAIPVAGLAALHGLRDAGKVQPGQKVLINGASGGVGTYAVQIGKVLGAEVTGVCSTRNVELVESLGADHVIDYTKTDFTTAEERYDLILDNAGGHSFSQLRRVLKPNGLLLPNSGHSGMGYFIWAFMVSPFVRQISAPYTSGPNKADLELLAEWAGSGKIKPAIDRSFPLEQTAEALGYVGSHHARAKVVIAVR